jgi:transcriptional antiterminator RfaH
MSLQENGRTIIDRKAKWYVLYVKSRFEFKVSERFAVKGIKHYLPTQKVLKQWSDRKKWVDEPLFRSYIFVHIGLRKYFETLAVEGIVAFVCFSGFPEPVPDGQLSMIKKMLASEMEYEVTNQNLQAGDKVKVIKGPLMGLIGDYTEKRGKYKVIIRMDIIGQNILVTVPLSNLEKV